ncbi:MAG: hypothetical protein PHW73_02240 [Atribacterota bacterium]|nr:hypothetical protein [Atribacterota bacterium]
MAYKNIKDRIKYDKEYSLKNKEKRKIQHREYYFKNKEKISKRYKEKYIPHPRILKTKKQLKEREVLWRYTNRKKINARQKQWRDNNREHLLSYRREYYKNRLSLGVQYGRLKASAKERNYLVSINSEEFEKIVLENCYYCNESEKRRGIDRLNSKEGYTKENSVPCCKICNYMKRSLTKEEFLNHINKIYNYKTLWQQSQT